MHSIYGNKSSLAIVHYIKHNPIRNYHKQRDTNIHKMYLIAMVRLIFRYHPQHFSKWYPEVAMHAGPWRHTSHIQPLYYFYPKFSLSFAILLGDSETIPKTNKRKKDKSPYDNITVSYYNRFRMLFNYISEQ